MLGAEEQFVWVSSIIYSSKEQIKKLHNHFNSFETYLFSSHLLKYLKCLFGCKHLKKNVTFQIEIKEVDFNSCNCSEQYCVCLKTKSCSFHSPLNIKNITKGRILLSSPLLMSNSSLSPNYQFPENPAGQLP